MDKGAKNYRKSQTPASAESGDNSFVAGEFTGHEESEIDLERGQKIGNELEKSSPSFRSFMDKLRKAAKQVAKRKLMLL